ncbi:MafI family immunity protein [Hymenobacter sp. HSC-4F20]|uniref:MafI family immunity protein n=1 Tax=Hymenobacter sp. HSC-4F20 TaxID=2864135 RepID=UPI001C72ACAE|nr:MafI family immunity protein [Hymenobacter sp. HSC-4F20]MBX0289807.1 MafI family immunity protein [Hymenobacter sp. HSC-4F20]
MVIMWKWWKEHQRQKRCDRLVTQLLAASYEAGLLPRDYANAKDMLSVGEYGCAFDIIVQQLYEHDVEISANLFTHVKKAADSLVLTPGSYFFLGELVRSKDKIPLLVKKELASIISSLQLPR